MAAVRAILSTLTGLAQGSAALGRASPWRREAEAAAGLAALPGPGDGPYAHAGPEPALADLLDDPVVRLIMRADHIEPAEMPRLLGLRPRHERPVR